MATRNPVTCAPTPPHTIEKVMAGDDKVGDRLLMGRHGGAVCHHYEIVEIVRQGSLRLGTLVPCYDVRVLNDDGTYSSNWVRGFRP